MINPLEELRERRHRRPFVPFVIVLKNGDRVAINQPLQFAFHEKLIIVLDDQDLAIRFTPAEIAEFQEFHPVA